MNLMAKTVAVILINHARQIVQSWDTIWKESLHWF